MGEPRRLRALLVLPLAWVAALSCQGSSGTSAQSTPAEGIASPPEPARGGTSLAGAAGTAAAALAAPHRAPLDRAAISAFVKRWVALQNEQQFEPYAALYAPGFVGIKRVGDKRTELDRQGWLEDRRRMFERDARVVASSVQILRTNAGVFVTFHQEWSTSTFADRGDKALTLEPLDGEWRIVREEMVSSELAPPSEYQGTCARIAKRQESGAGLRYYADLSGSSDPAPSWARVRSEAEAHERAKDGTAWRNWWVGTEEGWTLASEARTSPSGDWMRDTQYCFRPDQSLALLIDDHRTFYSEDGPVSDTVRNTYASDGSLSSSRTVARRLDIDAPARPNTYMRPPPILVKRVSELPFFELMNAQSGPARHQSSTPKSP